jgi:hypothetical protein
VWTLCCFLQAPDQLQLLQQTRDAVAGYEPLADAKKLAELKIENDDVVAMTYAKEGEQQHKHAAPASSTSKQQPHAAAAYSSSSMQQQAAISTYCGRATSRKLLVLVSLDAAAAAAAAFAQHWMVQPETTAGLQQQQIHSSTSVWQW